MVRGFTASILCNTLYCVLRTEMLKGAVDLMVLAVLSQGESYGYQVVKQLEANGWEGVGEATVYGTLRRLHDDGFLTSRQALSAGGRARRYYSLSEDGRAELDRQAESWNELTKLVEHTLKGAQR
jgi:PadR family transcriptional regulator PadR